MWWRGISYARALKVYCWHAIPRPSSESDDEYEEAPIFEVIRRDDKDAFVSMLKRDQGGDDEQAREPCNNSILEFIIDYQAVKCATALLQGETCLTLDVNRAPLDYSRKDVIKEDYGKKDFRFMFTPLHEACSKLKPSIVELFLRYGACKSLRTFCPSDPYYHDKHPLQVALHFLSCPVHHGGWRSHDSIYSLILWLCRPQLRQGLETVSVLVDDSKEISEEIWCYVRDGRLVEMAALLLVAGERVTSLRVYRHWRSHPAYCCLKFRQYILREMSQIQAMLISFVHNNESHQLIAKFKNRLHIRRSQLLLLEVCQRAGHQIWQYLKQSQVDAPLDKVMLDITCLLQKAGFPLNVMDYGLTSLPFWLSSPQGPFHKKITSFPEEGEQLPDSCYEKLRNFLPAFLHAVKVQMVNHELDVKANFEMPMSKHMTNSSTLGPSTMQIRRLYESSNKRQFSYRSPISMAMASLSYDGERPKSLVTALETLRDHQYFTDWSPKKSIFKLVYILCLPELDELLKTIKLFACEFEDIRPFTCLYAKDGKVVELAALLMVAHKEIITTTSHNEDDKFGLDAIHQCLLSQIQLLTYEEARLIGKSEGDDELVQNLNGRKEAILSALQLVGVFDRAGSLIDLYQLEEQRKGKSKVEVVVDVIALLCTTGFDLRSEDCDLSDMNCFSIQEPELKQIEKLSRSETSMDSQPCLSSISKAKQKEEVGVGEASAVGSLLHTCTTSTQIQNGHNFSSGSAMGSSAARSFHTCTSRRIQNGLAMALAGGSRSKTSVGNSTRMPIHFIYGNRWAIFALAAVKRGIKGRL